MVSGSDGSQETGGRCAAQICIPGSVPPAPVGASTPSNAANKVSASSSPRKAGPAAARAASHHGSSIPGSGRLAPISSSDNGKTRPALSCPGTITPAATRPPDTSRNRMPPVGQGVLPFKRPARYRVTQASQWPRKAGGRPRATKSPVQGSLPKNPASAGLIKTSRGI